jgi:hypothetical protein
MSSNYEYHKFLKHLYFEGYVDSYEAAEELIESLDDESLDVLIEDYNSVTIISHLISEGYTDNYESAIAIYESMSDEWIYNILEDFVPLTPEKEERVRNRVGKLAREIQLHGARMKELKGKPFGRFRPGVKKEMQAIVKSARKKAKQARSASDALIHASVSREASNRSSIESLKKRLRDLGEEP